MSRFSQSKFAARLQRFVSYRRQNTGLYREIAERLPLINAQRVLDIGTGTGLQLKIIHEIAPHLTLYGLDISEAAIQAAIPACHIGKTRRNVLMKCAGF